MAELLESCSVNLSGICLLRESKAAAQMPQSDGGVVVDQGANWSKVQIVGLAQMCVAQSEAP